MIHFGCALFQVKLIVIIVLFVDLLKCDRMISLSTI
jgi:hypothetical protein